MLQHVEVNATLPGVTAGEALAVLRDIEERVDLSGVVQSVETEPLPDGARASHWRVKFRSGLLVWTQRDEFPEGEQTMRFSRLAGDPATFEGFWRATDTGDGTRIEFVCDFDLGIPSLSATLDPLAVRILNETVVAQLTDIFGSALTVDEASDPAARAAAAANGAP